MCALVGQVKDLISYRLFEAQVWKALGWTDTVQN